MHIRGRQEFRHAGKEDSEWRGGRCIMAAPAQRARQIRRPNDLFAKIVAAQGLLRSRGAAGNRQGHALATRHPR